MSTILAGPADPPGENGRGRVPDGARTSGPTGVRIEVWINPLPIAPPDREPSRTRLQLVETGPRRRGGRHRRPDMTWAAFLNRIVSSRPRYRRAIVGWLLVVLGVCAVLAVLFLTGGDVLARIAGALLTSGN